MRYDTTSKLNKYVIDLAQRGRITMEEYLKLSTLIEAVDDDMFDIVCDAMGDDC